MASLTHLILVLFSISFSLGDYGAPAPTYQNPAPAPPAPTYQNPAPVPPAPEYQSPAAPASTYENAVPAQGFQNAAPAVVVPECIPSTHYQTFYATVNNEVK